MRVLLLTPPMVQLNTPYPATAYLTGFLRQRGAALGLEVTQADPALELFLRIFSAAVMARVLEISSAAARPRRGRPAPELPASVASFLAQGPRYVQTVDAAVRFLQGRDPGLA